MLETVRTLAGPRGSATPAEREAGAYVEGRMQEAGLEVRHEPFHAPRTFSWPYFILYLVPAAAVGLAFHRPGAGAVLALAGVALFYLELNFREILGRLLPRAASGNVVGRLPAAATARRRVVITAHLDSSKAALNFSPGMAGGFRLSFLLMAFAYSLTPVLLAAHALTALPWWPAAVPAGYLLLSAGFLLHRELWNRLTPGANDNASGVAVLLALAESLGREPPLGLELWFVATGAEESGTWGMADLLRRHRADLRDALFINLDNVGAGQVHYMAAEGMLPAYPAAGELLAAAGAAAGRRLEGKTRLEWYRDLFTLAG